jgi:hypothetical protein
MEDEQASASLEVEEPKRAWEPPMIEELDFGATEAAYIPGIPADLGIYTL